MSIELVEVICESDGKIINASQDNLLLQHFKKTKITIKQNWFFASKAEKCDTYIIPTCSDCGKLVLDVPQTEPCEPDVVKSEICAMVRSKPVFCTGKCWLRLWEMNIREIKVALLSALDQSFDIDTTVLMDLMIFDLNLVLDHTKKKEGLIRTIAWENVGDFHDYVLSDMDYFESLSFDSMISIFESNKDHPMDAVLMEYMIKGMLGKHWFHINTINFNGIADDIKKHCVDFIINKITIFDVRQLNVLCDTVLTQLESKHIMMIWNTVFPNDTKDQVVSNSGLVNRMILCVNPTVLTLDGSYDILSKNIFFETLVPATDLWVIVYESFLKHDDDWLEWSVSRLDTIFRDDTQDLFVWNSIYCLYLLNPILRLGFSAFHRYIVRLILSNPDFEWMLRDNYASVALSEHLNEKDANYLLRYKNWVMNPMLKYICLHNYSIDTRPFKRRKNICS